MKNETKKKVSQKSRGEVYITRERCKGCGICIKFCPFGVLAFSEDFNSKGFHTPISIKPEECTGCNLCGFYCPDFAIFSIRDKNPNDVPGIQK